jgi:hypothetical protein
MSKILEELLVGVIAGVLTFFLLEGAKVVLLKLFNMYRDRMYNSVIVEGNWVGNKIEGNINYGFEFQLEQNGYRVSGNYISIDKYSTPKEETNTRFFKVEGTIKNNYLSLSYFPSNRKNIGGGSFILQVLDDGNILKGSMCYLKTSNGNTGAASIVELLRKA